MISVLHFYTLVTSKQKDWKAYFTLHLILTHFDVIIKNYKINNIS